MAETTISWTGTVLPDGTWLPGYTANFWLGCQRVSPGCTKCYAEQRVTVRMRLPVWGPPSTTPRRRTKYPWKSVGKWNREARASGIRRKVFVASLSDFFERHPMVEPWRAEAFPVLEDATDLDILFLTKRVENVAEMVPAAWMRPGGWPAHCWVGTTMEDAQRADERVRHLLRLPAPVLFGSFEPLLEYPEIDPWIVPRDRPLAACLGCGWAPPEGVAGYLARHGADAACPTPGCALLLRARLDWAIVGGESGKDPRRFEVDWAKRILGRCADQGVAALMKQTGGNVRVSREDCLQFCLHGSWTAEGPGAPYGIARPGHRKGGDPIEWPPELRVFQFPTPRLAA